MIYENDYQDQLPPDLETLIRAAEMPANGLVCPATSESSGSMWSLRKAFARFRDSLAQKSDDSSFA